MKPTDEQIIKKQDAEQAVNPPTPAPAFIRELYEEDKTKPFITPDESDDRVLAQGSESDFWKILKKHLELKIQTLEGMTAEKVRRGEFDLQEIGFRYLIQDQTTNALQSVIDKVESTRKAIKAVDEAQAAKAGGGNE